MKLFLLYESAAGLSLFKYKKYKENKMTVEDVLKLFAQKAKFMKKVKLVAFKPFLDSETALKTLQQTNDGQVNSFLEEFLKSNLPSDGKKFGVGVQERILGQTLSTNYGYVCKGDKVVFEFFRSIRKLFSEYIGNKNFTLERLITAQLGLTHLYSRHRIAEDVEKQDKHILQSTALISQMEKNLNLFSMRIKEWYAWHFPELSKIVPDNKTYVKCVVLIQDKDKLDEEHLESLEEITKSGDIAQSILEGSRASVGQPNNEVDMDQVVKFSKRVLDQFEQIESLQGYLKERMSKVAPNFTALIGEKVGSKLLTKAGSLVQLAKYPASTIQILGAEKALFRAMNTGGNTPKYGLLYGSPFIGKAQPKDRGKISRYLANKCALACRLDQYLIKPTTRFGDKMREQVEARLTFLATGDATPKNIDVMKEVLDELKEENLYVDYEKDDDTTEDSAKEDTELKKRKASTDLQDDVELEEAKPKKKKKHKKKKKKHKKKKHKKKEAAIETE